jgi:hypothetical protein
LDFEMAFGFSTIAIIEQKRISSPVHVLKQVVVLGGLSARMMLWLDIDMHLDPGDGKHDADDQVKFRLL